MYSWSFKVVLLVVILIVALCQQAKSSCSLLPIEKKIIALMIDRTTNCRDSFHVLDEDMNIFSLHLKNNETDQKGRRGPKGIMVAKPFYCEDFRLHALEFAGVVQEFYLKHDPKQGEISWVIQGENENHITAHIHENENATARIISQEIKDRIKNKEDNLALKHFNGSAGELWRVRADDHPHTLVYSYFLTETEKVYLKTLNTTWSYENVALKQNESETNISTADEFVKSYDLLPYYIIPIGNISTDEQAFAFTIYYNATYSIHRIKEAVELKGKPLVSGLVMKTPDGTVVTQIHALIYKKENNSYALVDQNYQNWTISIGGVNVEQKRLSLTPSKVQRFSIRHVIESQRATSAFSWKWNEYLINKRVALNITFALYHHKVIWSTLQDPLPVTNESSDAIYSFKRVTHFGLKFTWQNHSVYNNYNNQSGVNLYGNDLEWQLSPDLASYRKSSKLEPGYVIGFSSVNNSVHIIYRHNVEHIYTKWAKGNVFADSPNRRRISVERCYYGKKGEIYSKTVCGGVTVKALIYDRTETNPEHRLYVVISDNTIQKVEVDLAGRWNLTGTVYKNEKLINSLNQLQPDWAVCDHPEYYYAMFRNRGTYRQARIDKIFLEPDAENVHHNPWPEIGMRQYMAYLEVTETGLDKFVVVKTIKENSGHHEWHLMKETHKGTLIRVRSLGKSNSFEESVPYYSVRTDHFKGSIYEGPYYTPGNVQRVQNSELFILDCKSASTPNSQRASLTGLLMVLDFAVGFYSISLK